MSAAARPRLTPHQAEVYARIDRQTRSSRGYARSEMIGCAGACNTLWRKGYITYEEVVGPRGGITYRFRSIDALADRETVEA